VKRTIAGIAALSLVTALASTAPAMADSAASVTMVCTQFGTVSLPPGPPPAQGVITVSVNGRVVTTTFVPGPCAAPGFLKHAGG
jgi:hypothetical protein